MGCFSTKKYFGSFFNGIRNLLIQNFSLLRSRKWTEVGISRKWVSKLPLFCEMNNTFKEFLINFFIYINTFDGTATLSVVVQNTFGNILSSIINGNIVMNINTIFTTKLQLSSNQSLSCQFSDFTSSAIRSSEKNTIDQAFPFSKNKQINNQTGFLGGGKKICGKTNESDSVRRAAPTSPVPTTVWKVPVGRDNLFNKRSM